MRAIAPIALLVLCLACADAPSPLAEAPPDEPAPTDPPADPSPADPPGPPRAGDPPTSDRLTALVSLAFGDAPVEGFVYLLPGSDGVGARYAVDLDEDGAADREGVLERGIGFRYRFLQPGVHRIRVRYERTDGKILTVEPVVIVNDPTSVETLAAAQVPPSDPNARSFEGIAIDPAGERLYIGDYRTGSLVQLDAEDLQVLDRIDTMGYSIEGLSVSPSGDRLFAVYKYHLLATVSIPEMVLEHRHERAPGGKFFIHALPGSRVLSGGEGPFSLVNPLSGALVAEATDSSGEKLQSWQFAVSEDDVTAVVVGYTRGAYDRIHVVDLASFTVRREIRFPPLEYARLVALDPHEPRAYVLGNDLEEARFLVVDLESGDVLKNLPLGPSYCSGYCVANPVAVGSGGRWVAMEWNGGAYLIDTELDLPLHRIGHYGYSFVGFSVAASPTEAGVFYFLDSAGTVRKVRVP